MPRKRYIRPAVHLDAPWLMEHVIELLQREDADGDQWALNALLERGPLGSLQGRAREAARFIKLSDLEDERKFHQKNLRTCERIAAQRFPQQPALAELRIELLAWLRGMVHARTTGLPVPIRCDQPPTFAAILGGGALVCHVDAGLRDVAILQLLLLLHIGGLQHLQLCAAPTCPGPRVFFKTYRREFCSSRCQKRAYMADWRARQREQAQTRSSRRRRVTKKG